MSLSSYCNPCSRRTTSRLVFRFAWFVYLGAVLSVASVGLFGSLLCLACSLRV